MNCSIKHHKYDRPMKNFAAIFLFLICSYVLAGQPPQQYTTGKLQFDETPDKITIYSSRRRLLDIQVVPGGGLWPPVVLDQDGTINAGRALISAKTGRMSMSPTVGNAKVLNLGNGISAVLDSAILRLLTAKTTCTLKPSQFGFEDTAVFLDLLKNEDIVLTASDKEVLALTHMRISEADGDRNEYLVWKIELQRCHLSTPTSLGDPDYLVELAWSRAGGWWISGVKEPTLLRSQDGKTWVTVALSREISNLISTYIVDDKEIWAAAIMGAEDQEPYELIVSHDGGLNWSGAMIDNRTISQLPRYWFEGLRRCRCRVSFAVKP